MTIPVVLWGAGGHGKVVLDILRLLPAYKPVGFLDDNLERWVTTFHGAPILGGEEQLPALRDLGVDHAIVSIGDNAVRCRLAGRLQQAGFRLIAAVHPRATLAPDVVVGAGTAIMAGAVVNATATLGDNVVVNTGATVDHDCWIGDGVHIAPGAHLAGGVIVRERTLIGVGANVVGHLTIGCNVVVGAGAAVLRDVPDNMVVVGVPAGELRPKDEAGEHPAIRAREHDPHEQLRALGLEDAAPEHWAVESKNRR